jgi:hypothetical protein
VAIEKLRLVLLRATVPFIAFGFLDNFIMIAAGDLIETNLGLLLLHSLAPPKHPLLIPFSNFFLCGNVYRANASSLHYGRRFFP